MRAALFITCFNDTLFPGYGPRGRRAARAAGRRGLLPRGADLLRADARQLRLRRPGLGAGRAASSGSSPTRSTSSRRRRRAWRWCASTAPRWRTACIELTEFLVDVLEVEDVGASFPHRVAYHPTCHSLRLLKVGDRPLRLLRAVQGIDLVEIEQAQECCGFGGTFAVKNADTSMAMLSDKLRHVLDTGAEVCTSADNSCLMHIGGALQQAAHGDARAAPGRDPGGARVKGFPAAARQDPARLAAAPQPRQGDDDDPRQAAQHDRRARRLGGAARGRQRDQGGGDGDAARAARAARGGGHRRGRDRALGARRRGGQRDRGRAWRRPTAPTR